MKIIKDPVHGDVEVLDFAQAILDSFEMQRLRYIRQLGFSYLVYPGANHSRFEHSLGTMHLADLMCRQLRLDETAHRLVVASALLHDIGHGPFSHAIEPVMKEYAGRTHQDISGILHSGPVPGILEEAGIDTDEVVRMVSGVHRLSGILHGDLDVDRMDYLLRDAHYTGTPYGTVDAHRLIRNTVLTGGGFVLHENGVQAAESLLIARTLMRPAVYFHHVSRIAENMFNLAVMEEVRSAPEQMPAIMAMDDAACMHRLLTSQNPIVRILAMRIYGRKLYKRALYVGREQVNTVAMEKARSYVKKQEFSRTIAGIVGIGEHEVIVDIPPLPVEMSMEVQVMNRDAVVGLREISPLTTTLNETRLWQWRLGVYTLPEYLDSVGEAAASVLGIRPATRQDRLIV